MKQGILLGFAFLFFHIDIQSQDKGFNFVNFTQDDDLPSNETYCVYKDSRNFLWIASDKGVVRYDGTKMQSFSLPDNVVFKIREDRKGRIWFFTRTCKLAYFLNEKIYPYKYNHIASSITNLLLVDACVDDDDNVLINSSLSFNYIISNKGIVSEIPNERHLPGDSTSVIVKRTRPTQFFSQMTNYSIDNDWLYISCNLGNSELFYSIPERITDYAHYGAVAANEDGIYFFSGNLLVKLRKDGSFVSKRVPSKILSVDIGLDGDLWVGTWKAGLILLDANLKQSISNTLLNNYSITSIARDYEGGIWFTTLEKGIFFLKNKSISFYSGNPRLLEDVSRIYSPSDSSLIIASANSLYNFSDNRSTVLMENTNGRVNDLFMDEKKNIYVFGSFILPVSSRIQIEKRNNIVLANTTSEVVRTSPSKMFWHYGTTFVEFNPATVFNSFSSTFLKLGPEREYKAEYGILFADQTGNLWTGTFKGLYKVHLSQDSSKNRGSEPRADLKTESRTIRYESVARPEFSQGITCMRQMNNGIYVLGIRFGGVVLMKDTSIIGLINEANGLLNNSIKYLLPIGNQLWIATTKGISVLQFDSYTPLRYSVTNIGKNDGFYNLIINQLLPYRGNILAATSNGLYTIENPRSFLQKSKPIIPFYISTKNYRGQSFTDSVLSVPYNRNKISINFNAVSFNSKDELHYYYRFSNKDTGWQAINSTQLVLENLSPGIYQLEIKAVIDVQQRSSQIKTLLLKVQKPWWQWNAFRIGVIFLIGSVAYLFYVNRIRKIRKEEAQKTAVRSKMVELEQKLLRSQMNPHFIFNSLSSIQQLIISNNQKEANEYLVRFSSLIRKTLQLSTRPFIKLQEEREYLNEYLALEQVRLNIPFTFEFEMYLINSAEHIEIPHMLIQPILENSIRHGVKHLQDRQGHIHIFMKQEPRYVRCTITDNGVGRSASSGRSKTSTLEHKSYGIEIIRKRLYILQDHSIDEEPILITDLRNEKGELQGTSVTLLLPYKINPT